MPEEVISDLPANATAAPTTEATTEAPASEQISAGGPAGSMSAPIVTPSAPIVSQPAPPVIESPPAAAQPLKVSDAEPRARLHRLAIDLVRNRNRRLLVEFLQLRRALR